MKILAIFALLTPLDIDFHLIVQFVSGFYFLKYADKIWFNIMKNIWKIFGKSRDNCFCQPQPQLQLNPEGDKGDIQTGTAGFVNFRSICPRQQNMFTSPALLSDLILEPKTVSLGKLRWLQRSRVPC